MFPVTLWFMYAKTINQGSMVMVVWSHQTTYVVVISRLKETVSSKFKGGLLECNFDKELLKMFQEVRYISHDKPWCMIQWQFADCANVRIVKVFARCTTGRRSRAVVLHGAHLVATDNNELMSGNWCDFHLLRDIAWLSVIMRWIAWELFQK